MLYAECHITTAPPPAELLEELRGICERYGFRLSKLVSRNETDEESDDDRDDSFCTGRSRSNKDLVGRMRNLICALRAAGFVVWRYKVEIVMVDSNYHLAQPALPQADIPKRYRIGDHESV